MFNENEREVEFGVYCNKCKHSLLPENMEPCNECLEVPYNESRKPVYYEETEK